MRGQVVGIPVEYDDNVERWRTHPLLMPKIELMSLSWDDTEVLKKVEVMVPARDGVQFKRRIKQGSTKYISAKQKLVQKQRSVLNCDKYSTRSGHQWQVGTTRFPALYKALVMEEPE